MTFSKHPWNDFVDSNPELFQVCNPWAVAYATNISTRYRYIYIETPKVACSSIKLTLQRLELDDPDHGFSDFEHIHLRNFSPLLQPTQVGSFAARLKDPNWFKFAFVRNPYSRLLSAYRDKILRNRPQKAQILRQLGRSGEKLDAYISFAQFVDAVSSIPAWAMDNHWLPQYDQLLMPMVSYDFIGRFEQLDSDLIHVFERLGVVDGGKFVHRERAHQSDADAFLREFYTGDLAARVYARYRRDFDVFGYSRTIL